MTAAFDGHRCVVQCLNRIEDLLAALRIVEYGAVDRRHQIARLKAQSIEYLPISAWVGAKASEFAGGTIVRGYNPHDLIEDTRILLHHAADVLDRRRRAWVAARATHYRWAAHTRAQQPG